MPHETKQTAEGNQAWGKILIEACIQQGLRHFFLAPGSRCTPLTLAVAQHPSAVITQHFDERGLAFACLGFGRATARPGVFLCTSGTAAANAFPAVIEAHYEQIPMLLLTADRPPELRDTGANQTIDQVHLFGRYPTWFCDLPCPSPDLAPTYPASVVRQAAWHAAVGPVHVNCMFREPFTVPDDGGGQNRLRRIGSAVNRPQGDRQNGPQLPPPAARDFPSPARQEPSTTTPSPPLAIAGGPTLVLLGGTSRREEAVAAVETAARLQAPLLSDVTSGIRSLAYDQALLHALPPPATVVQLGGRITSKRLWQFLEINPPRQWIHVSRTANPALDPLRGWTEQIVGHVATLCEALRCATPVPAEFTAAWNRASAIVGQQLALHLDGRTDLTEPGVARVIAAEIPHGHGLFLGNSMPLRDMDMFGFWPPERLVRVAANRGASGIDGVLATAVGFARGLAAPATLVIGDLSALHDLNSFALLRNSPQPIVVIVINNDGGGIFHFLPIASETRHFERFFATPHGLRFAAAAEMFDIPYAAPDSIPRFTEVYRQALQRGESMIVEVSTDRAQNFLLHRELQQAVRQERLQ